jgi:molecular chaperone GrpE (heat shock protein)
MSEDTQDPGQTASGAQFTPEQQEFVNQLVGEARVAGRESARREAEHSALEEQQEYQQLYQAAQARVAELEPQLERLDRYQQAVETLLEQRMEQLHEAARKAISALPESMGALERLEWVQANHELFTPAANASAGTPVRKRQNGRPAQTQDVDAATRKISRKF